MKFLSVELRKVLTKRFFGILVAVLLTNLLLFWHNQSNDRDAYDTTVYRQLQQDFANMDENQWRDYVEEKHRMLSACSDWDFYERYLDSEFSKEITPEMLEYQEIYENGSYLTYTNSLSEENRLFSEITDELQRIDNHRATLEATIQDAKLKTSTSIFAKPNTYAFRNQLAIIECFEGLLDIQPAYDPAVGAVRFQNTKVTDLLALILVLYICAELIVTEQKSGLLPVLRATKKGHFPLIAAKIITVLITAFGITLLLWGTNFAYCAKVYGLGDLSRPVQSLTGFDASILKISIGTYIGIYFISKWLLYVAVGILCLNAGLLFQNAANTFVILGGFLSIEYLLCQIINPISALNILKYVNVSNMVFTSDWFSVYRNINIFGFPVDVFTASVTLVALLLLGGIGSLCWLFCSRKTRVIVLKGVSLPRWPKWLPRPGTNTRLLGHELWKLLVECGTFLLLILFIAVNLQEPQTAYYTRSELFYKSYMEHLSGPMDAEKEAFLDAEAAHFADIRSQIAQLVKDEKDGKISANDLEMLRRPLDRALEAENVLKNDVMPLIERINNRKQQGDTLWLVYEPGYEYLFGVSENSNKATPAAIIIAGIILAFANYYSFETTAGMQQLLNVSIKGRKHTDWNKISIVLIFSTIMFLIAQIPDYWYIFKNYGLPTLNAPICSLTVFNYWSDQISILGGILIYEGLKLLAVLCIAPFILLLSKWTKNQLMTLCISTAVLLLPLLLHLLDLTFLDAYSLYLPMTGTKLLTQRNPIPLCLLYYGIAVIIGAASVFQLSHRSTTDRKKRRRTKS